MFFTFYYMYATLMQWWRLTALKNKIIGTLNSRNALLLTTTKSIHCTTPLRVLENLLFQVDDRIACIIDSKSHVNLNMWVAFPKNYRCFPIHLELVYQEIRPPFVYIIIRSSVDDYVQHEAELIQIEKLGELVAWKIDEDLFEVIVKTDMDHLAKLVLLYTHSALDINHELEVLEIETIFVEGRRCPIIYDTLYCLEQTLKYSYTAVHWSKFVAELRSLYFKIREGTNPKIKIESGTSKTEDSKKPVYEVKPIKKEPKKPSDDKNTLDVAPSDHRKHKDVKESKQRIHKVEKKKETKPKIEKSEPPAEIPKSPIIRLQTDRRSKEETKSKSRERKRSTSKEKEGKSSKEKVQKQVLETKIEPVKEIACEEKIPVEKIETTKETEQSTLEKKSTNTGKPPNILVYADSVITKENVKKVLNSIINNEKYTIYDLPLNATNDSLWTDSTVLVIICGNVTPELTQQLLTYLVNGGQLLCLCSDLLHSVLNTFTTAEVREHELVRFSYGEWRRVKMMHHIFCYQASPAKKQFSKDSVESNHSTNGSPLMNRTPSTTEIQRNGKNYTLQVQVLGAEETWQTPSLLLASVKDSRGRAVFSQVHLEIDPMQYEDDENKFNALKESNTARLQIMKDILAKQLEIDCNRPNGDILYLPGYFLGRHDMKMEMLQECKDIVDKTLTCNNITVKFCDHKTDPGEAGPQRLPVLILSCPKNFSTVDYFSTLDTDVMGRLVIYTDIITSTQHVLNRTLRHGLVVIARQQSAGVGRSKNTWLSPLGSACFSLQLHVPLSSPLGRALSLVQQIIATALVAALREDMYKDLDIGIKWPNDIYANGSSKIGGLIVNSSILSKMAVVNIGVGFNLDNPDPTTSFNNLVEEFNRKNGTNLPKMSYEQYFAKVFNSFENIYDIVQNDHLDYFYDLYYKYWMHQDSEIKIQTQSGKTEDAKVVGIDDFGFLRVKLANGEETTVHPDGNSFDMIRGLVAPKIF